MQRTIFWIRYHVTLLWYWLTWPFHREPITHGITDPVQLFAFRKFMEEAKAGMVLTRYTEEKSGPVSDSMMISFRRYHNIEDHCEEHAEEKT